ncbi:MAG TPA: transglycosylase SLT domain-containing protein, partial [Steroidobacteraceae bacterium]
MSAHPLPMPASEAQTFEADVADQDEGTESGPGIGAEALAGTNSHTVAGLTPEQYPDVFDRMRAGFKLDDIDSPRIDQQLAFYANNPAYLERVFGRAGLYLHHIVQEIESRGMPLELALLPVVESAFEPYAQSWVRANGLWQFMPGTGERFGLKQ